MVAFFVPILKNASTNTFVFFFLVIYLTSKHPKKNTADLGGKKSKPTIYRQL